MSTTDAPPPQDSRSPLDTWLTVAVAVLAALPRLWAFPLSNLNMHASRDLHRTHRLLRWEEFPLSGPELYFGGAVPGNFYYWFQAIPLVVWKHPFMSAIWIALLNAAAAAICYAALRMVAGRTVALPAAIGFALFPLAIVEGLYLWNPSFLPFFTAVGLWGLCLWLGRGKPAGLVVMLTSALLAMQIHLSAYAMLVAGLATFAAVALWKLPSGTQGTRGAGAIHLLLPLVLVLPFVFPYLWANGHYYFIDLKPPAEPNPRVGLFTPHVNPHALTTFPKAYVFQDDSYNPQEFIHFRRFYQQMDLNTPGLRFWARDMAQRASLAGFGAFAIIGAFGLFVLTFLPGANQLRRNILSATKLIPGAARPLAFAMLSWQVVPFVVLYKLTGLHPENPLGIPTRYVIVLFPVSMATAGLGFAWLWGIWNAPAWRGFLLTLFSVSQLFHLLVIVLFIQMGYRTYGVFNTLLPPFATKPIFVEERLSRFLATEYELTVDQFRERFQSDGHFGDFVQEQYLDFELFAGRGSDRAGAPGDLWFYFFDTRWNEEPPPLIRESGEVIDNTSVGPYKLLIIRREDPNHPMPWPLGQLEPPMIY